MVKAGGEDEAGRKDIADVIVGFDRVTDTVGAEIATAEKMMHACDDASEADDVCSRWCK